MISILLVVLVVGFLLWAIHAVVPMDGRVLIIFDAIVILVLILWILQTFGLLDYPHRIHL